ncbi:AEC family transporter [Chromatiaceae bacterium AAb-1]|nr:AEC family transporter [Chromatiaceae bacterium AAb-1]
MENFYLIFLYILSGVVLKALGILPADSSHVLNRYVLYIAMPALILQKIPLLAFSADLLIPAVTPWLLLVVVVLLVLLASRLFGFSRETTGALLIILPLGNTSFIGFPMVEALFGETAMPYALVYDQLGSFIALATYTTIIAALYSPQVKAPTVRSVLVKVLTFPSFIALFTGLLLHGYQYPSLAQNMIDSFAATLVPVVMVAVGCSLSIKFSKEELKPLLFGVTTKLIVMPLLVWGLWTAAGQSGLAVTITIFQAAMPPMISAGAVAVMAGLSPRLSSGLIGIGILCGFISLPVVYELLI